MQSCISPSKRGRSHQASSVLLCALLELGQEVEARRDAGLKWHDGSTREHTAGATTSRAGCTHVRLVGYLEALPQQRRHSHSRLQAANGVSPTQIRGQGAQADSGTMTPTGGTYRTPLVGTPGTLTASCAPHLWLCAEGVAHVSRGGTTTGLHTGAAAAPWLFPLSCARYASRVVLSCPAACCSATCAASLARSTCFFDSAFICSFLSAASAAALFSA